MTVFRSTEGVAKFTEEDDVRIGGRRRRRSRRHDQISGGMGDIPVIEIPDIVDSELPVCVDDVLLNATDYADVALERQEIKAELAYLTQVGIQLGGFTI